MDHCPGQFSLQNIMKIFKTDFFLNPFIKDKSEEVPCKTKRPELCTGCRVSTAKIYLFHSSKIAKAIGHKAIGHIE